MRKAKDLTGKLFNRWHVIERGPNDPKGRVTWRCRCACAKQTERLVLADDLLRGRSKGCGCLKLEKLAQRHQQSAKRRKERASQRAELERIGAIKDGKYTWKYTTVRSMNDRCYNPKNPQFKDYGLKGIEVCDSWNIRKQGIVRAIENFCRDMGERPGPDYSVDRRKMHLGYSKDNCRWATKLEQNRNRRSSHARKVIDFYLRRSNIELELTELRLKMALHEAMPYLVGKPLTDLAHKVFDSLMLLDAGDLEGAILRQIEAENAEGARIRALYRLHNQTTNQQAKAEQEEQDRSENEGYE